MRTVFTFFVRITVNSHGKNLRVNFYTRLTCNTFLGNNNNFNGMVIRGNGKVTIGDNFHSGKDILLLNSYHKYDFGDAIPYDTKEDINKNTVIKDNVWIGDRATILGGIIIGEGAIIQAGSVVVSDVEKYGIAGGNPAKVFKTRNIENYLKLKSEGKFC
jgi:acetyltransferase-like isoleucine patch superfamily enzyme